MLWQDAGVIFPMIISPNLYMWTPCMTYLILCSTYIIHTLCTIYAHTYSIFQKLRQKLYHSEHNLSDSCNKRLKELKYCEINKKNYWIYFQGCKWDYKTIVLPIYGFYVMYREGERCQTYNLLHLHEYHGSMRYVQFFMWIFTTRYIFFAVFFFK